MINLMQSTILFGPFDFKTFFYLLISSVWINLMKYCYCKYIVFGKAECHDFKVFCGHRTLFDTIFYMYALNSFQYLEKSYKIE